MKQTAVEWLANELYEKFEMKGDGALFNDLLNQANKMFEQQIIDAFDNGVEDDGIIDNAEQYYNETFGKSTPWYDEDKTTERMNIIGQNGNNGEHY
jgi:hypothetical protein